MDNKRLLILWLFLLASMPSITLAGITFEKSEYQLQAKPGDTMVEASYGFVNTGMRAVKIMSMNSSCGCTTAKLPQKVYEPGDKGEIQVKFEFGNREGWQQKLITVKTDDPDESNVVLKLIVKIPWLVTFNSRLLSWSTIKKTGPQILRCFANRDLKVNITELDYDEAALWVKELPCEKENERRWAVAPKDINRAIESAIRIKADYPGSTPREYTVQVRVEMPASVKVEGQKGEDAFKASNQSKPGTQRHHEMTFTMSNWLKMVFHDSDALPLRLDKHMILLSPGYGDYERYVSGVVLADIPIEIEKVEVKGRVNCQAELVSLDWDGYFMIKLMPKKEAQTLETTGTTVSGATTKPQSKHGEILIHTNPPSPASRPIYGFVHQPAGGDMSSE